MTRLRIVSLNAWGGQVWDELKAWIPEVGADVLCLQEMIRAPVPSPEWLRYVDANRDLAQRADLFGDVSALLPGHQAQFAAAARGPLTDVGGKVHVSEHGLGIWVVDRLAISQASARFVHGAFRERGWGEEPVPRTMQIVRVEHDGASVLVAHMHGLRDPSGKGDTPARLAQARAALANIEAMKRPNDKVVFMGDFNILPDSGCFDIWADGGLSDLVARFGIDDTRTSLYSKPSRHANYCLVSEQVQVRAFDAPATPVVSDHRPLILDIDIS